MLSGNVETIVKLAEYAVVRGSGTLATLGLGSCVAVVLHDATRQVGALGHVLLPSRSLARDSGRPAKFADQAVPAMLEAMGKAGADPRRIEARLVGGAAMFAALLPTGTVHMGERNVLACRKALRTGGIPIVAEEVGGDSGRSVYFDVASGTVTVRAVGHEAIVL